MTATPAGTITFLAAQVDDARARGDLYPDALHTAIQRHLGLVREAIETNGGDLVREEGGLVCAAFATAPDAVQAAADAQRALAGAPWGTAGELRVRVALHTGLATARDGDYAGPALNRVRYLLAAAHGGQALLSAATRELARDHLPEGVALRDLSRRRLKDLLRSERIFQLVVGDLPANFPPPRTLDARPSSLPIQHTALIGREAELEAICVRLRGPETRALMLTGPGGIGKTRLALQAAAELIDASPTGGWAPVDGVFFVALGPVADPTLVVPTIAQVLKIGEGGGPSPLENVRRALQRKEVLLVLDDLDPELGAAATIGDLLASCPRLKVLATGRQPMGLAGEREFAVPPLTLPEPAAATPETLTMFEAVRLFVQRALEVDPGFAVTNENAPAVAEICHRLDGIPLAIELAAARARRLAPPELLERLASRLNLLTPRARKLPARNHVLRGVIAWSYELLAEPEQALFRRLAVFGGATPGGAAAVAGAPPVGEVAGGGWVAEGLEALAATGLLRRGEPIPGDARFEMLTTVREYGMELLRASGEAEAIRRAHALHFLELVEEAETHLTGAQQSAWLGRLEREHDNLRAALEWAAEIKEADLALRMAGALWRFWWGRGHFTEGRQRLGAVLSLAGRAPRKGTRREHSAKRAKALAGAAMLAHFQGDSVAARFFGEESLELWRKLDDKPGIAQALNELGHMRRQQGDHVGAAALHQESLEIYRQVDDRWGVAASLNNLGYVAQDQGDYGEARALYTESLGIFEGLGNKQGIASALGNLGNVAHDRGDARAAESLHRRSLEIWRELGSRWGVAAGHNNLGNVALLRGDHAEAREHYEESLAIRSDLGDRRGIAELLECFARLAAAQGQRTRARCLAGAAASLGETIGLGAPARPMVLAALPGVELPTDALGGEVADAAWLEGRAMTLEQALAYAQAVETLV